MLGRGAARWRTGNIWDIQKQEIEFVRGCVGVPAMCQFMIDNFLAAGNQLRGLFPMQTLATGSRMPV